MADMDKGLEEKDRPGEENPDTSTANLAGAGGNATNPAGAKANINAAGLTTTDHADHWETLDQWSPGQKAKKPGPLDVYTQEEWQQALDYYKGLEPGQTRQEFEDQMECFHRIYATKAETAIEAGIDLSAIIESLERRFYRVKFLFDSIPNATELEIQNYHRVHTAPEAEAGLI